MTRADDELTIQLWRDGETVHVDGGNGESYSADRDEIVHSLLPKYQAAGWVLDTSYELADPTP
ncbi:hypothetical protein ACFV9E_06400 [Streptomyces sp. NPDC059835]|uniref:hypothetical protein n=1 Tax=Streptomyces sp. NPDC059835 TaxID=3346967 RepID=UPI0036510138